MSQDLTKYWSVVSRVCSEFSDRPGISQTLQKLKHYRNDMTMWWIYHTVWPIRDFAKYQWLFSFVGKGTHSLNYFRNKCDDIYTCIVWNQRVTVMPCDSSILPAEFSTLRPRQNGRHFADDTFKSIFLNENVSISIKVSLRFVPNGPINNIPALVQKMACRRPGDKPLSEPMMVRLATHICVSRPQWVKACISSLWLIVFRSESQKKTVLLKGS